VAKAATKPRAIKGLSVAKLKESAILIVNKEIGRQLTPAGRQACLDIGVLLVQVLEAYQVYYQEVGHMAIDLATIKDYFTEESWAEFTNNQKLTLQAAIKARANGMQEAINRHMNYLLDNKRGMDTMGPKGQDAAAFRLLELQGLGEEVAGG